MKDVAEVVARAIRQHNEFEREHGPLGEVSTYVPEGTEAFENVATTVTRYLAPGAAVLDFGAGRCLKAVILAELGYRVTAFDDFSNAWHLADPDRPERIKTFARQHGVSVVESISECHDLDMVMLHDVLEHLPDSPRPILESLLLRTKSGGYLFVTVPNAANARKRVAILRGKTNMAPYKDYYWHESATWRGHHREYVGEDLRELAKYLTLEVRELRTCHHMLGNLPPKTRPWFKAATTLAPGLRDTWLMVAQRTKD